MDASTNYLSPLNNFLLFNSETKPTMELPEEIGLKIFLTLLSASEVCQTLIRTSLVCRSWNQFIDHDKIWDISAQILGYRKEKNDPTPFKKAQFIERYLKAQTMSIGDISMNKKEFFDSIQGLYGIDLDEVQTYAFFEENLTEKPILAKDYLSNPNLKVEWKHPMQITYREAFEYIIKDIDNARHPDFSNECWLKPRGRSFDSYIYSVLSNITPKNAENIRIHIQHIDDSPKFCWTSAILDRHQLCWMDVICQVLKDKGFIKDTELSQKVGYIVEI